MRFRRHITAHLSREFNGSLSINNFDIHSTFGFPIMKKCLELSNEKFPNLRQVALLSISEFSKEDWDIFVSEQ